MMKKEIEEISFEEALKQLQSVVDKLEQGDVPLEVAISMFQEGMQLSKICHEKLTNVEKQLEQILNEDEEFETIQIQEEMEL